MREIYLRPGEEVRVVAGPGRPGQPLISEEERAVRRARQQALSQAREAARQLSLGLRHLQGGDPATKSSFTMDAEGKLSRLARELQRSSITCEQLLAEISSTYRKAAHPPTLAEAYDLARAFVDWLPGYEEGSGATEPSSLP